MKRMTAGEKRSYVEENVGAVLPKMESIKDNLNRVAPYGNRVIEAYNAVCKSVDEDILMLRGIEQYASLDFMVRSVREIAEKVPSYMMELGKFQSLYSKKK